MVSERKIVVHYFERKAGPGRFSIERVFDDVRAQLPPDIEAKVFKCPYESKGILNRVRNMLWARRNAGSINHITGDVHYLALGLPKKRTILTIADCSLLVRNRGLRRRLLWLFWYRLPIWGAASVTTISEFTKQELLRYVKCKPALIHPFHCPVAQMFQPWPKPFNAECPVALFVGTTLWNKNLSRLIAALNGIRCRLEIVGPLEDSQRDELKANNINFSQYQNLSDEGLLELYHACDFLVLPSLYEGFGLPIVEAQAVGRPVATSNRCSMPEVAGRGACLVDPDSTESIRDGLLRIIGDEAYRENLIQEGFENVKRFAPEKIAAQYAKIYRALAP